MIINITFPDGSIKKFKKGVSANDIAMEISEGLARNILCANVNNELWDTDRPINNDAKIILYTWKDKEGKMTFWHSTAHLMAEALEELYPGVKLGIGPAIENGFYYDIDLGENSILSSEDFSKIENLVVYFDDFNQNLSKKSLNFFLKSVSKL